MKLKRIDYYICIFIAFFSSMQFWLFPLLINFNFCDYSKEMARFFGADQSVFIYIGRLMHQGFIPYKDLFDHKGIVLYFIEYIGTFLSPNNCIGLGVWILELINIILFVFALYKIVSLFSKNKILSFISVFLVANICSLKVFWGCNYTEEFALPWISFSFLFFLKFILDKKLNFYEIIFTGASLCIVLFLKCNLIGLWLTFLPIILFICLKNKLWKELKKWLIGFTAGFLVILFFILIYLLITKSLNNMIEYYLFFNFSYKDSQFTIFNYLYNFIKFSHLTLLFIPCFFISLFNKNKKIFLINTLFYLVELILTSISGRPYNLYAIILLPPIVIYIYFSIENVVLYLQKIKNNNVLTTCVHFIIFVLCVLILFIYQNNIMIDNINKGVKFCEKQQCYKYIINNSNKNDNVLVLGNTCKIYLVTNRTTKNKFFFQNPIKLSEKLYKEFINELKIKPSNLIILPIESDEYIKDINLKDKDNLQKVYYNYLGDLTQKGIYKCEIYDDFVAWKLVKK